MGTGKHVLDGLQIGATWRIRRIAAVCGGDAASLSNYFDHLLNLLKGSIFIGSVGNAFSIVTPLRLPDVANTSDIR